MVMLMVPEELAGSFNGVLLGPADAGYDDARAVHNGLRSFVGVAGRAADADHTTQLEVEIPSTATDLGVREVSARPPAGHPTPHPAQPPLHRHRPRRIHRPLPHLGARPISAHRTGPARRPHPLTPTRGLPRLQRRYRKPQPHNRTRRLTPTTPPSTSNLTQDFSFAGSSQASRESGECAGSRKAVRCRGSR